MTNAEIQRMATIKGVRIQKSRVGAIYQYRILRLGTLVTDQLFGEQALVDYVVSMKEYD